MEWGRRCLTFLTLPPRGGSPPRVKTTATRSVVKSVGSACVRGSKFSQCERKYADFLHSGLTTRSIKSPRITYAVGARKWQRQSTIDNGQGRHGTREAMSVRLKVNCKLKPSTVTQTFCICQCDVKK